MEKIKVSAVQFAFKPINNFEDFASNVNDLVNQAKGSDFVIFPEAFTERRIPVSPISYSPGFSDVKKRVGAKVARNSGDNPNRSGDSMPLSRESVLQ